MSLPLTKIYVDSKFKTPDSVSSSDFKFQLQHNVFLPEDAAFYIDEVSIPRTWYSIETNINDKLYVMWQRSTPSVLSYSSQVTIPSGQYGGTELALAIKTALIAKFASAG